MKNTKKKIKLKLLYHLLWNKFVRKFPQTIKRLLNIPTVAMASAIVGFGKIKEKREKMMRKKITE